MVVKTTSKLGSQGQAKKYFGIDFCSPFKGDCLQCDKNGTCELQAIAQDLQFDYNVRYPVEIKGNGRKIFPSIHYQRVFQNVLIIRCFSVCNDVQTVCALSRSNAGIKP